MWIDSHCHLNHPKMRDAGSVEEIVSRAKDAGVEGMLTICCEVAGEFEEVLGIAQRFDNVWCTVGTHPHESGKAEEKDISLEKLAGMARSDPKIIGIGETGLDYHYNYSEAADQQNSFRKHIRAALETNLPLIIHARSADEDIIRILKEEGKDADLTGVMHCFSSSPWLAEQALDLGFYISFSGILTFKKSQELRDIAANVPLDKVLLETDAPYLAPEPYRGRVNEPSLVGHTGHCLAEIYRISKESMATHSKNNFFTLFKKAKMS